MKSCINLEYLVPKHNVPNLAKKEDKSQVTVPLNQGKKRNISYRICATRPKASFFPILTASKTGKNSRTLEKTKFCIDSDKTRWNETNSRRRWTDLFLECIVLTAP